MAARGINKVILVGNLGADPDMRYTAQGNPIANMSIATSESWKDKNTGEPKEHTEWHRVVIFGRLAEIAGEYLKKGSKVYLEGQQRTRKWQDNNGTDRYTTEVVLQGYKAVLQMLDGGNRNGGGASTKQDQPGTAEGGAANQQQAAYSGVSGDIDIDDEIPF